MGPKTFLFILILILGAVARAGDDSIQNLLDEASKALVEKPATPKKQTKPRKIREEIPPKPTLTSPTLPKPPEGDAKKETSLSPMDMKAVEEVLSLDLKEQLRESEVVYPRSLISIALGTNRLTSPYNLSKDDDTFSTKTGSVLQGLEIECVPQWKIRPLSKGALTTLFSVSMAAGFFQGNLTATRSGVQSGDFLYKYQFFPVDGALELSTVFWNRAAVFLSYGFAAELIHQSGEGTLDSTSDAFYGEVMSLGLRGAISDSFQLFVAYKYRGTKLILRQPTGISGQMLLGGLIFSLTG